MIVVDTSAVLAILLNEPDRRLFELRLATERCIMSAVNVHEAAVVMQIRLGEGAVTKFWGFILDNAIGVVPFDVLQARAAATTYGRYGKGNDPRARLNLCDCAAYALAKTLGAPLLFKGDDFSHTDLASAL